MCYYYTPEIIADQQVMKRFRLKSTGKPGKPQFSSYYSNGFNHEYLPVITMEQPETVQYFRWGLVPFFIKDAQGAKDISNKTLNARCETIFTTASYKHAIKDKRCLIPAQGFIEWHTIGKEKYPYYIEVRDLNFPDGPRPFCFGGIYSRWVDRDSGEVMETFSIVTTPGNALMEFVHNSAKRMPLILSEQDELKWLDPTLDPKELEDVMKPYPASHMTAYSISKLITTRKQEPNDPQVLMGYDYELEAVPPVISGDLIDHLT